MHTISGRCGHRPLRNNYKTSRKTAICTHINYSLSVCSCDALTSPPSDEGGGFCRRQKTEGETKIAVIPMLFSPSVTFGDSSLVRGSWVLQVRILRFRQFYHPDKSRFTRGSCRGGNLPPAKFVQCSREDNTLPYNTPIPTPLQYFNLLLKPLFQAF